MTDRFRSLPDLSTLVIIAIGALTSWTLSGSIDAKEISAREISAKGSSAKEIAVMKIPAAVAFVSPGAGWAVGPGGRITRLAFTDE